MDSKKRPLRIDSHQHFWKYNTTEFVWMNDEMRVLKRDFLPLDLQKELRAAGFDGSIAVQARQSLEETKWLLKLADEYSFIKGIVGWIDLRSPQAEKQLSLFSQNKKFIGVRHIVQDEPDDQFLLRKEFLRGIEILQEHTLPYDILIYPKHLRTAVSFVEKFPAMRFVLDHIAKPF
ncbi:MAG: amidohydrolase family protein, partial [Bacteroidota bacterium]|nr:amidohydrolase family protein [Bacteroidota bacterium]